VYNVQISRRAEKHIKALPKTIKKRVSKKLITLRQNPFSGDVKKLKVRHSRYRLRVGDYRIIFDIDKESITILVLTVRHRKDVYR